MTYELVGRDVTKMEYFADKSLIYVFNLMALRKDIQDEDAKRLKEMQRK